MHSEVLFTQTLAWTLATQLTWTCAQNARTQTQTVPKTTHLIQISTNNAFWHVYPWIFYKSIYLFVYLPTSSHDSSRNYSPRWLSPRCPHINKKTMIHWRSNNNITQFCRLVTIIHNPVPMHLHSTFLTFKGCYAQNERTKTRLWTLRNTLNLSGKSDNGKTKGKL